MINKDVFNNNMQGLSMLFNYKIDKVLMTIYYRALQELTDEQFTYAVNKLVQSSKFMPKPAEILEVARGNNEAKIESAWQMLVKAINVIGMYEDVQFEDEYLAGAVHLLGGWLALCEMTEEDFKYAHVTFRKVYGQARRMEPFRGIVSIENEQKGYGHRELAIVSGKGIKHIVDGKEIQYKAKKGIEHKEEKPEYSVEHIIEEIADKKEAKKTVDNI